MPQWKHIVSTFTVLGNKMTCKVGITVHIFDGVWKIFEHILNKCWKLVHVPHDR